MRNKILGALMAVVAIGLLIAAGTISYTDGFYNIAVATNSMAKELIATNGITLNGSRITAWPSAITALTGDVTATGPGSAAATLAAAGTAGTYGDATHFPVVTTDSKGRVTAVATNSIPGGANWTAPNGTDSTLDGTATANVLLSATNFPFIPSKTYMVWGGDSVTAGSQDYPYILYSNTPYSSFKLFTNIAVAGIGFVEQTNTFFTNVFSKLPQNPGAGTNVIVSMFINNDFIHFGAGQPWTNITDYINSWSNWVQILHGYGWKAMAGTPLNRGTFDSDITQSKMDVFRNWVMQNTNIDFAVDCSEILPNYWDTTWFSGDFTHPTNQGQALLARGFDYALRGGWSRRGPTAVNQSGTSWQLRQPDGTLSLSISSNGVLSSVRGGTLTNLAAINPLVGGVFGAGGASATGPPALEAVAGVNQTSGVVFGVFKSDNTSKIFEVDADSSVAFAGGSGAHVSGITDLNFTTAGAGTSSIQLQNNAANGKRFDLGSRNSGSFAIYDQSITADIFAVGEKPTTLTNNGTNTLFQIGAGIGKFSAVTLDYKIYATDGTDQQIGSGICKCNVINKANVMTYSITDIPTAQITTTTAGTLTWVLSAINSGTSVLIKVAAVSSLTTTTLNFRAISSQQGTAAASLDQF